MLAAWVAVLLSLGLATAGAAVALTGRLALVGIRTRQGHAEMSEPLRVRAKVAGAAIGCIGLALLCVAAASFWAWPWWTAVVALVACAALTGYDARTNGRWIDDAGEHISFMPVVYFMLAILFLVLITAVLAR